MTATIKDLPIPAKYEQASSRFRIVWIEYVDKEEQAKFEIVNMVQILERNGYSRTRAIEKIVNDHSDLKGFSRRTIYNRLPEEMKNTYISSPKQLSNTENVHSCTFDGSQENDENVVNITTSYDVKDPEIDEENKPFTDQLPKPVLRLAESIELSPTKLELIAKQSKKTILKEHPQIQKQLVEAIAPLTIDQSRHTIFQKVRDLETGYLKLNDNGQYVKGDSKHREIVKGGDKVLEPIQVAHMDITKSINEFLFRMTDRSITHGEFEYNRNIIKNTKDYRLSVIKVADKRTLTSFEDYFILVSDIALEMLELIQQEFDSRDMKKDMEVQ